MKYIDGFSPDICSESREYFRNVLSLSNARNLWWDYINMLWLATQKCSFHFDSLDDQKHQFQSIISHGNSTLQRVQCIWGRNEIREVNDNIYTGAMRNREKNWRWIGIWIHSNRGRKLKKEFNYLSFCFEIE